MVSHERLMIAKQYCTLSWRKELPWQQENPSKTAKIKGVFDGFSRCCGNPLCQDNDQILLSNN